MVRPKTLHRKRRPNDKSAVVPPTLEDHQVIIRPLITEKGTFLVDKLNTYSFQVHVNATKEIVKRAVQNLFEVRVDAVRTINAKAEHRRFRGRPGTVSGWKKAIVKLHPDDKIPLF